MTNEHQIWRTYPEVSTYAKRLAAETQKSVTVVKVDEGWVVLDGNLLTTPGKPRWLSNAEFKPNPAYWEPSDIKYTREEKERAQAREVKLAEEYAAEHERQRPHLEILRRHYMSLTEPELSTLWAARETLDLDQHECDLLRSVLRHVKGITPGTSRSVFWQQHATINDWDFT